MLSEEFVAGRVFEGDVRRAERDRELLRRVHEERAERRAAHAARRAAAVEALPAPDAAVVAEPIAETAAQPERELAHAGR